MTNASRAMKPSKAGRPKKYHTDEERRKAALVYTQRYRDAHREEIRARCREWMRAHRERQRQNQ